MVERQEALSLLRTILSGSNFASKDILEDVLPKPLETVAELEALSSNLLEDAEFNKKMVGVHLLCCQYLTFALRALYV